MRSIVLLFAVLALSIYLIPNSNQALAKKAIASEAPSEAPQDPPTTPPAAEEPTSDPDPGLPSTEEDPAPPTTEGETTPPVTETTSQPETNTPSSSDSGQNQSTTPTRVMPLPSGLPYHFALPLELSDTPNNQQAQMTPSITTPAQMKTTQNLKTQKTATRTAVAPTINLREAANETKENVNELVKQSQIEFLEVANEIRGTPTVYQYNTGKLSTSTTQLLYALSAILAFAGLVFYSYGAWAATYRRRTGPLIQSFEA
jgi:hypothetical protein